MSLTSKPKSAVGKKRPPKKDGAKSRWLVTCVYLDRAVQPMFRAALKTSGRSISSWMRREIEKYLLQTKVKPTKAK